jgi:hypothetical protein
MDRLVLTAGLRAGTRERALELAAATVDPTGSGFERLSIYLSESEVIFLIEAPEAHRLVRRILDEPARAAELSPWLPCSTGRCTAHQRSITGRASRRVSLDRAGIESETTAVAEREANR